ncbi:hypothetical protein B5K06_34120 [Rhizobium grahamii]|uniref:Uncharacterized protein n=1 Tax=Rhizobium grahamii TaxID=1120045 RepID=A0A370KDY7_9HYPH|nr:hypothetical protein B5K06_34120 [Rhizobium grahamii]
MCLRLLSFVTAVFSMAESGRADGRAADSQAGFAWLSGSPPISISRRAASARTWLFRFVVGGSLPRATWPPSRYLTVAGRTSNFQKLFGLR